MWQISPCLRFASVRSSVFLCLPALVYVLATLFAHQRGDDGATGDEPHYLQVAESIARDADVNLDNNHGAFGPLPSKSHCVQREHGWFSIHNLGLAALVALPSELGGPIGARVALALFAGLVAPALYQVINAIWQQPRGSCMLALALALGMPVVHASRQIYPDLPAGILLFFLAGRALTAQAEPACYGWRTLLAPAALAFLPWLHLKYAGPALVVCLWYALAGRWRRSLLNIAALIASLALLACYNWYAFGKPTGPYAQGNALNVGLNSFIVFMGLHFDQAQGMFLQQPLWLLGLVGLAPLWHASRRNCTLWVLLYAAALLPNAMHPNWYGGGSFIGRFGATAVLLWAVPLAYAARSLFAADWRGPAALAAASVLVQLCLAGNWLTGGQSLLNYCDRPQIWRPCVWSYNGFVPSRLRDYLPYWQPFVAFWRYPANFTALVVAGGLLTCGLCLPRRPRLALRYLAGTSLLGVCLAVALPAKLPRAYCTGDQLPELAGMPGQKAETRRVASEGVDPQGPLAFAHGFFPQPGEYQVAVDFQAQGTDDAVGYVMFHDGKTLSLLSILNGDDQQQRNISQVRVPGGETRKPSTILVWYTGHGTLSIARLEVERRRR